MTLQLPITDPVLIVAIAMTIFLIAPLLFERMRIPGIIGLIVFGAVLGPHGFNLLARDTTIVLLGTVGLLYLVFLAALELDLHRFAEYRRPSVIFGLISFGIPMGLATAVMPMLGFDLAASLLIGSIIGSHTLLAYPIASRLGLAKNRAVTTVVGGTLVTDTLALAVLALVAGSVDGGFGFELVVTLVLGLGAYVAVVAWGVPRLGRWFFRNIPGNAPGEFIFLMMVLFASAYMARVAGAQPIIGAFLAGLTLNHLIPQNSPLMNRVRFVGGALFIPFFLLSVGMLVDMSVLTESLDVWVVAAALVVLVNAGKLAAALVSARFFGFDRPEGIVMFGLSVPQAAATLAVTFVGLEIGLFGEVVVNGVIVMVLVTGLIGPWLVEHFGRSVALREEQRPYVPAEAPRRILIPIANPQTAEALMDLAFLLRDPLSEEAIYPLMVVREDMDAHAEEQVAEAEKMLGHAVIYGAGADVPVIPITRVDRNIASGISRGITETRSSLVVVGWDGQPTRRAGIFGSVLDQLLARTKQLVVVAKLGHPLNTTKRILLVVPPRSDRHPGFFEAARSVKVMANLLGAALVVYSFRDDPPDYLEIVKELKPQVPVTGERLTGWPALMPALRAAVDPDDLVAVISAREGTLPWHPKLERLPGMLASLLPESFLMIYPSEADTSPSGTVATELAPHLAPRRVVTQLEPGPFEYALKRLLAQEFEGDPVRVEEIAAQLIASENEFSSEVRPGVAVPHALVDGLDQPILFLGTSPTGIEFPKAREPVRLIFLLLSPLNRPQEHLNVLAEIAQLVSKEENVDQLVQGRVPVGAPHESGSA
jgi:Kef-type K+ transport system membrane component KefB/mannitol/fructose-specific phosphotransferase system IIA component (Ntr-type)